MPYWQDGDEWDCHVDPASGAPYYINRRTGTSSWLSPDQLRDAAAALTAQSEREHADSDTDTDTDTDTEEIMVTMKKSKIKKGLVGRNYLVNHEI